MAGLSALMGWLIWVNLIRLPEANFSQYPGFDAYLDAHPPRGEPPTARERRWLRAHRPRFFVAAEASGPVAFYRDYIGEGRLRDGDRVSSRVDRALLNAHRLDPSMVFRHTGSGPPAGAPRVPARVDYGELALPGMEEPVAVAFATYHLVFRRSGLAAGIPAWQRWGLDLIADTQDWHQLDHYAAVTLMLVAPDGVALNEATAAQLRPVTATMQQHNYQRTYVIADDASHPGRMTADTDGRVRIDVAQGSHALFPHADGRRRHRAVRFMEPTTADHLVNGTNEPWIAGDDITDPAREVAYELAFLPPADAFYMFRGWLGERRRLPGRDGPPGAFYNTLPPLQPPEVQVPVFFWFEGADDYPADWAALDTGGWRPPDEAALRPFAERLAAVLPCRPRTPLPCETATSD